MSIKNQSRCKTDNVISNREYNILRKSYRIYCPICAKRGGSYEAYCGPRSTGWKRQYKTWKHTRKTQYKIKPMKKTLDFL